GLVDLFVLPRRRNRLTDLVTPLKALEIMARAKPLLASNCGGHSELVEEGVNGYLFDVSRPGALGERIQDLALRSDCIREIGRRARDWVGRHRTWEMMVRPTIDLYSRLAGTQDVV